MCCIDPATDSLNQSDLMYQNADRFLPSLNTVLRYSRNFRTFRNCINSLDCLVFELYKFSARQKLSRHCYNQSELRILTRTDEHPGA